VIVRLGGAALEENAILPETLQVVALGQITIKVVVVLRPSPFPPQAAPTVLLAVVEPPVEAVVEAVVVAALGRVLAAVAALPSVAAFLPLEADSRTLANKILAVAQKAVAAAAKGMALRSKATVLLVVVVVVAVGEAVEALAVNAVGVKDAAVLLRSELIVFADPAPHLLHSATVSVERFMSRRVRLALGAQKVVNVTNALRVFQKLTS